VAEHGKVLDEFFISTAGRIETSLLQMKCMNPYLDLSQSHNFLFCIQGSFKLK